MNARYYNGLVGQFISEDPSFLSMGDEQLTKQNTGKSLQEYLTNPQLLNSYSYANDNPIKNSDPNGKYSLAPALPILAIPGIGEALTIGGIAVMGGYAIYEVAKTAVNYSKGNHNSQQVPTLDLTKFGLNQSPMGFDDWNPKNLDNKPKWIKWGTASLGVSSLVKETIDWYKEQKNENKVNDCKQQQISIDNNSKNGVTEKSNQGTTSKSDRKSGQ